MACPGLHFMPGSVTIPAADLTYWQQPVTAVDTLADLRKIPQADNGDWTERAVAIVNGSAAFDDGSFFFYSWIPTSADADNAPTVIKPTAITGAGRWKLISWNNGGVPVITWKTGAGDPNSLGIVADGLGQRYFNTINDGTNYWNGITWA